MRILDIMEPPLSSLRGVCNMKVASREDANELPLSSKKLPEKIRNIKVANESISLSRSCQGEL